MKIQNKYSRTLKAAFIAVALMAQGCGSRVVKTSGAADDEPVIVAAASNLSAAFDELGRHFTARTGTRVTLSYGATGDLARQIENGAPFDVFAAADVSHIDELANKGLVRSDTRALYALGRVVLWTPQDSVRLTRLEDLADSRITKIAVAKPETAPYGAAAIETLHALNIWSQVEPKIVYAENVTQAKQFAATKNADAAFIPRSLVKAGDGAVIEVDERLHRPIEQALGVVTASKKLQAAQAFVDFVLSEEGQSLLEKFGYVRGRGAVR